MILYFIIFSIIGYLCGCLNFGYFIGKMNGIDLRKFGSGSTGSTNVLRNLGVVPCIITFVGDMMKAVIPIVVIRCMFSGEREYLLTLCCGLAIAIGHNYPFYLGFKGGKGIVVTSAVVIAGCNPIMIPVGLSIFLIAVIITRYVSVGSLLIVWYITANTIIWHRHDEYFVWMMVLSLLFAAFGYFQHRENIKRLIHGEENKLHAKKKSEDGQADKQDEDGQD